jgi:glycerol-3-phosphate dehydrogenase
MRSFSGRAPLPERVDIIVLGGGVNGVAIARVCAQARKSVLLIERDDFASGSSSRGSRIVHGGLQALERGSLGLFRDSLHGRAALLREQPHLVHPFDFVHATGTASDHSDANYSGLSSSEPMQRAAIWLYRKLGRLPPTHSAADMESLCRSLDPAQHWSLSPYQEAQCEFPERLVADWLRDACAAGAVARNHATVLAIRAAEGRVRGVLLRDNLTAQESYVESEWVINATGPWVDLVRDLTGLAARTPLAGGVRSSYLMLRPWPGSPTVGIHSALRRGSISIAPWNGMLQIGATQVDHSGDPSRASPSAEEVEFLLASAATMFPAASLTSASIAFSYAGVSPIATGSDESLSASSADPVPSRHILHNHADEGALGLLSIFGGTLATVSALAHKMAQTMGFRLEPLPDPQLAFGESRCAESTLRQWASSVHASTGIPLESNEAIARWHGRHAMCVIQSALHDPIQAAPIVEGRPQLVAQAVEAVAYERAVTLADILLRRVPIALDQNWDEECTVQAAASIAPALYWNERRIMEEIEAFEEERSRFLHKPKIFKPTILAA